MDSHMKVAALGKHFALGMLYDARNCKILPGISLWDSETLKKNTIEEDKPYSDSKITTCDSLEERASLLDVEVSMKASFLGGLVEVGGSAKYLNDKKKFKNQSRVTMQYKATTKVKNLSLSQLKAQSTQPLDDALKGSATHVVTKIVYGANAFFVFDSQKLESSKVQNIQAKVEAAIRKIPKISVEGQASLELNEEEKSVTNNLSCTFYGDFILESNPTTFEEAVKTYQGLPHLLRNGKSSSVPIKVWLTPLNMLDPTAAELKKDICPELVRKAENAVEEMRNMEMRCNDSLEDEIVGQFSQVEEKLSDFKDLCSSYIVKLQNTMKEKFPSIRAGEEDESSVEKLFVDRDKSPFSQDKLNKWMYDKEREINLIRSFTDIMKDATIVRNKSELDKKILGRTVEQALCFTFTSLGNPEPYLIELSNHLHSDDSHSTRSVGQATKDQWYSSNEVSVRLREKAETFQSLAKALNSSRVCFLIAAIDNDKHKGASIYHYKQGILVTDDFSQPAIPPVRTIKDKQDLIWYACDLSMDQNTANGYITLSDDRKNATCEGWRSYPSHPERFDQRTQVLCKEGLRGRHYWEVELSEGYYNEVGVGVTYKGISRIGKGNNSGLGCNNISWYFGLNGNTLCAWHNGQVWSDYVSSAGCRQVGVFLDWPGGTLSFYRVSPNSNTVTHLYTFSARFSDPVYPGFYIYNTSNYTALRQVV